MSDTSRFPSGIHIKQTVLPATAPEGTIVEIQNGLHIMSSGVWIPMGGAKSSGLFASGSAATVANTVTRQTFSEAFTPLDMRTIANEGATITIKAGGTFIATGAPNLELNVISKAVEQVFTFTGLGASGNWSVERTMVVPGEYTGTQWPVVCFTRYEIDGEAVVQDPAAQSTTVSTFGVAVEWQTAAAGNSITQTCLSVTVAR
jgi:hypothetical protein